MNLNHSEFRFIDSAHNKCHNNYESKNNNNDINYNDNDADDDDANDAISEVETGFPRYPR